MGIFNFGLRISDYGKWNEFIAQSALKTKKETIVIANAACGAKQSHNET
jgi:hypothetical protein